MIWPVDLVEVDIVCSQIPEALFACGNDSLGSQMGRAYLGSNYSFFAPALEALSEDAFGVSRLVALRGIEKVDPRIQGSVYRCD